MDDKRTVQRRIKRILFAIFALAFMVAGSLLLNNLRMAKREADAFDSLSSLVRQSQASAAPVLPAVSAAPNAPTTPTPKPTMLPQFKELYDMNSDVYGWITIEGTTIDYPVMLTPDDPEYYLHMDFQKGYSFSGVPFIGEGFVEGAPNTIIYGHHMNDGSMFAGLEKYVDKAFYSLYPKIEFDTLYGEGEYEIIAAFRSQVYYEEKEGDFAYYKYSNIQNEEQFDEYVSSCKAASIYDTGVTAEWGDKLITLSTCAYHVSNGRFVVVARKIVE